MSTSGGPAKKPRCKEQNAESQRRFRERQREKEEVTLQLIQTKMEELDEAVEERKKLDFEHQILLSRFYVGESIYQGQRKASPSSDARNQESNRPPMCSIMKDLAVLLSIPQCPPPLPMRMAPLPSSSEDVACVGEEADHEGVSVNTPQCSNANNTEISSANGTKIESHFAIPNPPVAAPKEAAITATTSSGVDTESMVYLNLPPCYHNLKHGPRNLLETTNTDTSSAAAPASGSEILAAVQSKYTADQFVRLHSNLVEALSTVSISFTENGTLNTDDLPNLSSLHTALSNIYSLYWHTAQLKPEISVAAAHANISQNTEFAVEIASDLVQQFDSKDLAEFRKASRDYERQMSRVSVSMESWIERIKACVVPDEPVSFAVAARVSLELVKCVSNLNAAVADGVKARRNMLQNLKPKMKLDHIAFINLRSYPYMPDHVAVYTLLQETAREMHRNSLNTNTNNNTP